MKKINNKKEFEVTIYLIDVKNPINIILSKKERVDTFFNLLNSSDSFIILGNMIFNRTQIKFARYEEKS